MRSVAILVALAACTVKQGQRVKKVSEAATAGGIIGMLAAIVVAEVAPDYKHEALDAGYAFVPVTLLGALVYIAADQMAPAEVIAPPPRRETRRDTAWALTKQAAAASRDGDCAQVQAIDPRVHDLDAELHVTVFLRDAAIRRCLAK